MERRGVGDRKMTKYPTMEELINEARVREISYADIFEQDYYDTLDEREFSIR